MDADRHVHPRPAPRSTPQRLKIESTGGHPCSRHGVTTPPTDRHRADDAVTATITPSRWRPTPPSSSSSKVTASSPFSVPGNRPADHQAAQALPRTARTVAAPCCHGRICAGVGLCVRNWTGNRIPVAIPVEVVGRLCATTCSPMPIYSATRPPSSQPTGYDSSSIGRCLRNASVR